MEKIDYAQIGVVAGFVVFSLSLLEYLPEYFSVIGAVIFIPSWIIALALARKMEDDTDGV